VQEAEEQQWQHLMSLPAFLPQLQSAGRSLRKHDLRRWKALQRIHLALGANSVLKKAAAHPNVRRIWSLHQDLQLSGTKALQRPYDLFVSMLRLVAELAKLQPVRVAFAMCAMLSKALWV
jgi:hypothetical protein